MSVYVVVEWAICSCRIYDLLFTCFVLIASTREGLCSPSPNLTSSIHQTAGDKRGLIDLLFYSRKSNFKQVAVRLDTYDAL